MKTNDLPIPKLGLLEIFLIQVVLYALIWLISDYTATLISVLFPILFISLLVLAFIAELVQQSKVPKWYYWFMVISIIAPLVTALIFIYIMGVNFDWTSF